MMQILHKKFMILAIKEAKKGVKLNHGGPFGAVIIRNGKVVSKAHNEVIKTNDPTAHAEILAIRKAAAKLKRFDLSDCVIYSTCQPCPMCLSAIYWAKMKKLFYGTTKDNAAEIGFDDKFIYEVLAGKKTNKKITAKQISYQQCLEVFNEWNKKEDKVMY